MYSYQCIDMPMKSQAIPESLPAPCNRFIFGILHVNQKFYFLGISDHMLFLDTFLF